MGRFDRDGSGGIDVSELRELLMAVGMTKVTEEKVASLHVRLDRDAVGERVDGPVTLASGALKEWEGWGNVDRRQNNRVDFNELVYGLAKWPPFNLFMRDWMYRKAESAHKAVGAGRHGSSAFQQWRD